MLVSMSLTLMCLVSAQAFAWSQPAPVEAQISQDLLSGGVPRKRYSIIIRPEIDLIPFLQPELLH